MLSPSAAGDLGQKGLLVSCGGLHSGPAPQFVGPGQNENTLVPKRIKISRWRQQSIKPSVRPSGHGPLSVREPYEHTGLVASDSGR